jgi:hypothetical protein
MSKRAIRMVALTAGTVLMALSWFLYGYFYDSRLEHNFERVSKGMTQQEVRSVMGKPDTVGKCGELGGYPEGYSNEYLYKPMIPAIETWAFFFDSQGRVLDKYEYQSP